MMKYNIFWGMALAAGLTACSNEEDLTNPSVSHPITFTSSLTRASGTTWDKNDQIGVFMTDEKGTALQSNVPYVTKDGDGFFQASSTPLAYPKDGGKVDFIAYYPYEASVSGNIYKVNLANQSEPQKVDLLYSNNAKGYAAGQPSLAFSHQLAQLTLHIQSEDGKDLSGLKVTVGKVPVEAEFNLSDGTLAEYSNTPQDVELYTTGEGTTLTASAFLLPQTSASNLTITLSSADGTKSKTQELKNVQLQAGSNVQSNVKVKGIGTYAQWMETPTISAEDLKNAHIKYVTYTYGADNQRNYSMLFDENLKMARWVAYPLNASYTGQSKRPDNWSFDTTHGIAEKDQINVTENGYPEHEASNNNGNKYDRGHQIPNADRNGNKEAQLQTFLVTNQTPQYWSMNQKIWGNLENKIRTYAPQSSSDTLFVVTGPVFEGNTTTTDNSNAVIKVPSAYFKAIAHVTRDAKGNVTDAKTVGFFIPNTKEVAGDDYHNYIYSVETLEKKIGYTLFPKVPRKFKQNTIW